MSRSTRTRAGQATRWTYGALAAVSAVCGACLDRPVGAVEPVVQSSNRYTVSAERTDKVDLLVVVDNSNSMAGNQSNLMAQLGPMIDQLTNPPCRSRSNPSAPPHRCDERNPDDARAYPPVADLHVGIISTDLGTSGRAIPGLSSEALRNGDDGMLNPIRYGASMATHQPWMPRMGTPPLPEGFRPASCGTDPMRFPRFLAFCSSEAGAECGRGSPGGTTQNAAEFSDWFRCNAGLYLGGFGIEQPLEAIYRALVVHGARAPLGSNAPNAGFLRDEALLAIVVLTDEEDGSVRNCDEDRGFSAQNGGACNDARTVFDRNNPNWASPMDLNERFYRYEPGSAQDPTWALDRYVNLAPRDTPNRFNADLLSLKPGHPERIVFGAIAGVPLQVPTRVIDREQRTDWDALLGAPGPAGRDDFVGRDRRSAIEGTQGAAGSFSMRGQPVDGCEHVAPACRREGSTPHPSNACADTLMRPGQYMAFPSRRIVEIARRFDEAPLCNGQPCRNGLVTSICSSDYRGALATIIDRIQQRLQSPCLQRPLDTSIDSTGAVRATCTVREEQPEGVAECDASRGRTPITDGSADVSPNGRKLCEVAQVATHAEGTPSALAPVSDAPGWFYDRRIDPSEATCRGRVRFTPAGEPRSGASVRLECIQRVERRAPTAPGEDAGNTR
jgi:hypothetical protein